MSSVAWQESLLEFERTASRVTVEDLVREYARTVFRVAFSVVRNHADAEDVDDHRREKDDELRPLLHQAAALLWGGSLGGTLSKTLRRRPLDRPGSAYSRITDSSSMRRPRVSDTICHD